MSFDRFAYILQVTPDYGPEHVCPVCKGLATVPADHNWSGPAEPGERRSCPLCRGSGYHRNRLTIMEREALAIFNDLLPEEGMLYPTITPMELEKLRVTHGEEK